MGVKSCSRPNCESIMCDMHITGIGYVCNDCEREFKAMMKKTRQEISTEAIIYEELKNFMKTKKTNALPEVPMFVDQFFQKYNS